MPDRPRTGRSRGVYRLGVKFLSGVMRAVDEQHHRGRAARPGGQPKASYFATGPRANQVRSWDISYLPGPIKGIYYYLHLILDIFNRDIVGWEIWQRRIG